LILPSRIQARWLAVPSALLLLLLLLVLLVLLVMRALLLARFRWTCGPPAVRFRFKFKFRFRFWFFARKKIEALCEAW
jgi:hypothetical protein